MGFPLLARNSFAGDVGRSQAFFYPKTDRTIAGTIAQSTGKNWV